jgi:ferredoxin/flavodoxin---NADP+ reductase
MANVFQERVLTVHHWTDSLFSFTTTRDPSFRFLNGQFTMIGIEVEGKPLMRAYSMVSANYDETLEYLSIKVPNGPLTSRLMHIQPGDTLLVNSKAVGTLILQNVLPGKNLYLLSTGTGMAPFMSVIKDPETYERFEKVILVHGVRNVAELAYHDYLEHDLPNNEFFGEQVKQQLIYYPTVTRESFRNQGRITDLIEQGKLEADIGLPPMNKDTDRVMICGSPEMLRDLKKMFESRGWDEGNMSTPGHFVIERAFVEK